MTLLRPSSRLLKPATLALCLVPLGLLAWYAATGRLGANPIEAATRHLGWWTLTLLLAGLAVSPARHLTGAHALIRIRRMVGLFAFAYAALHMLSYIGLDRFFDWGDIRADLLKRPYITIGMLALLLLVPLAATSTDAMVRRLGGKRWQRLHTLVYPIAVLGVVHYYLLVKADVRGPLLFGAVLAALLGFRVYRRARRRAPVAGSPPVLRSASPPASPAVSPGGPAGQRTRI